MRFSRFLRQGRQPNAARPGRRRRALLLSGNREKSARHCPTQPRGRPRPFWARSSLPDPSPGASRRWAAPVPWWASSWAGSRTPPWPLAAGAGVAPVPVSVPPARPYINTGSGRAPASGGGAAPARHGAGTERHRERPGRASLPKPAWGWHRARAAAGLCRDNGTKRTPDQPTRHGCESWQRFKVIIITKTPNWIGNSLTVRVKRNAWKMT